MLDIYICEDNRKQLDLFTRYINDTILIESLDMQVVLGTSDPNEVLKKMRVPKYGHFFPRYRPQIHHEWFDSCTKNKKNTASLLYYIYHITFRDGILTFQYKVDLLILLLKTLPKM